MGKVDLFVVKFYGNKKTFYPGEVINGTVILRATKELKLRRITLEFHGNASIHWKETRAVRSNDSLRGFSSNDQGRETVHYRNSETYINTTVTLFGKAPGQGGDNPVLAAGEHSYPFQFQIPSRNLPTSVETTHGSVRYWLKGIIDRPWRFNVTTKAVFTIIEYVDINTHLLLQPCETQMDRNVCSLCCTSGLLSVTLKSDRGGYCPGESIAVSATINNQTNSVINGLEVQLVQHTAYYSSEGRRKVIEQLVARVKTMEGGVRSRDEGRVDRVPLLVPSLPPTMTSSSCMKISYYLRLKVRVRGADNSYLNIPITIGSIPYRPPLSQLPTMAPTAPPLEAIDQAAAYPPPYAQYGYSPQPQYPPSAPPSYAECVYGGAPIQDEGDSGEMMGDKTFTPMYPFVSNYQFPPSSTARF